MLVQPIGLGAFGFDTFEPMTAKSLDAILAAGWEVAAPDGTKTRVPFEFVGRYVENLTTAEIELYGERKVGLFTIGEAPNDSMACPSGALGSRDGLRAVTLLRRLGISAGPTHALDVEGCARASGPQVIDYVDSAWDVVHLQTEMALYRGWGINLDADELYHSLSVSLYYASSPQSVPPSVRGYAMVQVVENVKVAGYAIDVDRHDGDRLGGTFHVLSAAP